MSIRRMEASKLEYGNFSLTFCEGEERKNDGKKEEKTIQRFQREKYPKKKLLKNKIN